MNANLRWAQTIQEQGWINPAPYHPYNDWMRGIAPYEQWEKWWGGGQIYQQSPLYAYLLAAFQQFSDDLIWVTVFQGLLAICLCILLGLIAVEISGQVLAGKLALLISMLYAPFYVYSWIPLRDVSGWIVTAAVILIWLKLAKRCREAVAEKESSRSLLFLSLLLGLLLGVGYLSRETYLLIIPLGVFSLGWLLLRKGQRKAAIALVAGLCLSLLPLMLRNHLANAPLLSSSNRFAETFIQGHAKSAHPYRFVIPRETGAILESTGGKPLSVIAACVSSHDSFFGWVSLQVRKVGALMDPFEPEDNLSVYFVERISPVVKWGLKHWMIITPGLGGLLLGILRRDKRHWPLWVLMPVMLATVIVGVPLSRYRQFLMVLWIPWAACFFVQVIAYAREKQTRKVIFMSLFLLTGWTLSLGPLARCPRDLYERSAEYNIAAQIYQKFNQPDKARRMKEIEENLRR
jgi:4-amino-4-deoxy-L-arabinose transferase-like glycosyltransferase